MGGLLSPATIAATASAASRAGDVASATPRPGHRATPEQATQTGSGSLAAGAVQPTIGQGQQARFARPPAL